MTKTIAIIGGGFSGTMSAINLLNKTTEALTLYLIEKVPSIARGRAYAQNDSCLLLNVRADQMGAYPDSVGHFYEWLQSKNRACSPADFISRALYGDYLEDQLNQAIQNSAQRHSFSLVHDEAIAVKDLGSKGAVNITLKSGRVLNAKTLVLAMGLETPSAFPLPTYLPDSLTIKGTGLSMVDAVISLHHQNYQGVITAVSRRGRLPHVHHFHDHTEPRPVYEFLTPTSLTLQNVFSTVRMHLKKYPWRLVIDGLRPHTQKIWASWTPKEKAQFLRHLRPLWDVHRHRLSPQHQEILNELIKAKRLIIKAKGHKPYHPSENSLVLNCKGANLESELIDQLRAENLISIDPHQLGIESQKEWLHVIGPLKRGQLWESTAVPEIRVQAMNLAHDLERI